MELNPKTLSLVNHLAKVSLIFHANLMMLGAFGNVKIGWLKADPSKVYAIKTMKKAAIIKSKHVDHIENEKKILEKLVHPFAVSSLFLTHSF
jgi:serine/threonine protein kinase